MARQEQSPEGTGPVAHASAALDAARRDIDGLGKKARRQFERLERRIATVIKLEAKRRDQLDDARTELASLIERVAEIVRPASSTGATEAATEAASQPAAEPAPKRASKTAAAKPTAPKPGARKPAKAAAAKATAAKPTTPQSAAGIPVKSATAPAGRRRSLRPAAKPTSSSDS
jgi:hypothetical protein